MKRNIQKIKRIIKFVIIVVSLIILFFSAFIKNYFGEISFEQLLFNIIYSEGANYEIVIRGFIFVIFPTIAIITIYFVLNTKYKNTNTSIYFIFRFKTKSIRYKLFSHSALKSFFLITSMLVISVQIFVKTTGIDEFILMQNESTSLYDDNYISAKEVSLKFPNKKRNLIIIYSESLESTNISTLNGGNVAESYIPYLEQLALENVNFSNNDKIGGALSLNNTNWTMAALVSYSAGVPLKLSISANDYK